MKNIENIEKYVKLRRISENFHENDRKTLKDYGLSPFFDIPRRVSERGRSLDVRFLGEPFRGRAPIVSPSREEA